MMETNENNLDKTYRITSLIVSIQILFCLSLIIFGWFFAGISDNSVTQRAVSLIWITIILLVIASFVLRRVLFSWERLQKNIGQHSLFTTLQINTIFLGMIGLIIGAIGFLVATLSGDKLAMFRVGAVSLIVFLFNFPRRSVWQKIVEHLEKGRNENL